MVNRVMVYRSALVLALVAVRTTGAQGTTVRSSDGRATLTIPDGVDTRSARIRLVGVPDSADPSAVRGAQYRVEPDSIRFARPATLTIVFDPDGLPGGVSTTALGIAVKDGTGWSPLRTIVDSSAHTTTASLDRGAAVTVRWQPRTQHCTGAEYRALDFRLGRWNYRAAGFDPGRTTVTADASGCALYEQFADVTGGHAFAFFIYDLRDSRWHSTTIDPGGRSVASGGPETVHFVMYHSPSDREVYARLPDGSIGFTGERSSDGGRTWAPWFSAMYTRDSVPR